MSISTEKFMIVFILMGIAGFVMTYITKRIEMGATFTGLLVGLAMGITAIILFWYFGKK